MIIRTIQLEMSFSQQVLHFAKLKSMFSKYDIPIVKYQKYKSIDIGFNNAKEADDFIMKFFNNLKNTYEAKLLY